jgi:hypothetical protein
MSREQAKERMVPVGEGGQFPSLVREAVRLGLIQEDEKLKLAAGIEPMHVADHKWLVNFINQKLCVEELAPDHHNYPVGFALAWLLTRRPSSNLKFNGEHNLAIQEDLNGPDTYDVTNSARGAMLGYWAKFLGYASSFSDGTAKLITPDPTNAIASRLGTVFETKKELPVGLFLKDLARLCPVLEGGVIREQVERRLKRPRAEATLSPATSLALLRLETRGTLTLDAPSDANIILLDQGPPRRLSHVRKGNLS